MKTWVRLDNAAKIFPVVSNKHRTNLFSIAFSLTEVVDPVCLQEALQITIMRFPSFKMRLRSGMFWFYLEENRQLPNVEKENAHILEPIDKYQSKGYLFRVSYFENKITMEVFHTLTDGYGATEFMKALVHCYLNLQDKDIDAEGKILVDDENYFEKSQDSFQRIYDERVKPDRSEERALHFKGTPYEDYWLSVVTGIVSRGQFKELITKFNCTYTQFMVGLMTYCANKVPYLLEKKKYPFQVFVAVDLRRLFPSQSLRNFSMIVKSSMKLNPNMPLEDYVKIAKEQLTERVSEKYLLPRVIGNIKFEKMWILRIVPLFLKKFALKIGYARASSKANSLCISNLGEIDLPEEMKKYVKKIIFSNGAMKETPINLGVTYYNDLVYMTFTSSIVERDFQKVFFRELVNLGLDVTLENNDLEG
ncbi:MAG: hypothetical protein IJO27_03140 [Bacilli bacterium]|nr:hypothetical protein [Bacilli bacterium]